MTQSHSSCSFVFMGEQSSDKLMSFLNASVGTYGKENLSFQILPVKRLAPFPLTPPTTRLC